MTQLTEQQLEVTIPRRVDLPDARVRVDALIEECGGDPASTDGRLISDLLLTSLKLITDERDTGELKLLNKSFKELRHAYRVFGNHPASHRISIFGSARTPPDHPDYLAAVEFSRLMAQRGWLVITGAGDGIMKAGHEGPGADASFGLAIRLPFETTANTVIAGNDKLVHFRYFFTRKLMFLSQCHAVAAFPGGFGTQDELMECLTLVQTGKSAMIPMVLIEGPGSRYWDHWDRYVRDELLRGSFIGPEDTNLYHRAASPQDAAAHVSRFYANYHSSRYVGDDYVIRIKHRLTDAQMVALNREFSVLVRTGDIHQRGPYQTERDLTELPRIAFTHTRRSLGTVRRLIDRINDFAIDNGARP
jgi:uncharacterized protein (TIGR00730 family)